MTKTRRAPLSRRTALARILLPCALLLAACTSSTDPGDGPTVGTALQAQTVAGVYLLTQRRLFDAYPDALFEGRVHADAAGCVRLQGSESTVLWPPEWTARQEGGAVVLVDEGGDAVGAVGDTFRMGGGHVPSLHEGLGFGPDDEALAARCPGDFWLAAPGSVEPR